VSTTLERIAIIVASLLLSIGLIAVLSGFFAGRDQPGVSVGSNGPGAQFKDLGHAHLGRGEPRPLYDSIPPTSGAHIPEPVTRQNQQLNDDQLLQALELGNVVIMYGSRNAPNGLEALARSLSGPFRRTLAAAGQAVVLARRPGTTGLVGLAWAHSVHVSAPDDSLLRAFTQYWLGRGAPGR
jgi:hypothetical protein